MLVLAQPSQPAPASTRSASATSEATAHGPQDSAPETAADISAPPASQPDSSPTNLTQLLGNDPDWKPPATFTASTVYRDYQQNELKANGKYGRAFIVTGTLNAVSRTDSGDAYAALDSGRVRAMFSRDDERVLRDLKVGQHVELLCMEGRRVSDAITLQSCDTYH